MRCAVDTNVVVYQVSDDPRRGAARALLETGPTISVQVLNEFANIARRKLGFAWHEIESALAALRELADEIVPITETTHGEACRIARRYNLSIYDALLIAAALHSGCERLMSENMHHGLVIDGKLRILNPFVQD